MVQSSAFMENPCPPPHPDLLAHQLSSPLASSVEADLPANVEDMVDGEEAEEASGRGLGSVAGADQSDGTEIDSFSVTATPSEMDESPDIGTMGTGIAGMSRKATGTSLRKAERASNVARPITSKVAAAGAKHFPAAGHSHSAGSASSRTYLRSSSAAAISRRTEVSPSSAGESGVVPSSGNGGNASPAIASASPVHKRRNSIASSSTSTDAPSTPVRRNSFGSRSLLQPTPSKPAAAFTDSRRASLSSSVPSRSSPSATELQKWGASPAKSSSLKGPTFGKPSGLTLQAPRSSAKPGTTEASKRISHSAMRSSTENLKPSLKQGLSSPRTSSSPSFTPSSVQKTSASNGAVAATPSRRKLNVLGGPSIKSVARSLDSPGGISSKQSASLDRASSFSSSVANRPASPLSVDRVSTSLARRKSLTSDSRDSRFVALPQVEAKAGDDVRLDLRGHKVRSIDCNIVNLTPKLEFVYLRDNKLSMLTGIEILRRVKVLDLSFNEFKGAGFEPLANCKALQQLYLAGNQITSLSSLPQLPNLEFLSVAQNKLKSLAMATQPRLQVLAASKNKISTLKGFPYLPLLEHLRLEENPILEMPHVEAAAILLVGPTLKKFNDRDLPSEEQELAQLYPANTALCLRDGWDFCDVEAATESTMQFLVAQWSDRLPPGYAVKKALIDRPFEEDPCRCHFLFEKDNVDEGPELILQYQWYIGDKTPTDFILIEGAVGEVYWPKHADIGRCLKVECTLLLGEKEYPSIFAVSLPVSPGTGCPKVLNLRVDGEPLEGNVIYGHAEVAWCGGTPGKGIVSWLRRRENSSPVAIVGAEENEYQLTLDDNGANLLLMYTPVTEEGVKGEASFATTAVIQAALPHVSSVHVVGDPVEGKTIRGAGRYFGGREGLSKFEWLREDLDSGEFKLVSKGTAEYVLSAEDVGLRMMFIYTPVNSEGFQGDPVSAITGKVLLAPPKVTQLRIVGDIREGNKVAVNATVSGGLEGASRVQWFKTNIPDPSLGDANLEAISTSKIAKAFRIPLGAVGFYLAAKYTPVRSDGESGEPGLVFSDTPVEMLPPSLNFLSITGEFVEGETLTASYGYIGGHEGSSNYSWYLHENESDPGVLIPEAAGLLQYQISKEAVDKFISFKCIPVRDDGLIGEGRSTMGPECIRPGSPKLLSLQILGDPIEGAELQAEKKYWGGDEGPSKLQWFLTRPDGAQREIKGARSSTYKIHSEDIDGLLCVSCEPIRADGVKGVVALSQLVGPVLPAPPTCESLELFGQAVEGGFLSFKAAYKGGEKGACTYVWIRQRANGKEDRISNREVLDLTSEDIGCRIELVYTPVRKDGFIGSPYRVVSDPVKDAEPVGFDLVIPDCYEDEEVSPQNAYFGGQEGASGYTWFRLQHKLEGLEIPEGAQVLADSRTYTPTLEDVGAYLALRWIPTRKDGKKGKPLVACSGYPVAPAPPAVHNVTVKEISRGVFAGEGEYYGGLEGDSHVSWYRETADGVVTPIAGATSMTYEVSDEDYTCHLIFGYAPVRQDGAIGKLVLSEPSVTVLPEMPRVQKLVLTGKSVEGEVLTALEVMPKIQSQQRIWEKYKKDIKYQWSRSSTPGNLELFELLPPQRTCSYKVRSEDIGYCMRCECIVTDIFGRSVEPVSVVTSPIAPGMPKVDRLEIEGRGYHTNLYAVRGIYSGGKEGKSLIQWFRAMAGSPDLIPIPGEVGRMYESNVDDVGYRLVAVYTPVREDGMEGAPVSASTEPIAIEPEVAKDVKQKMELGAAKFEALRDRDRSPMKAQQQQGLGSLERRVLDVNRKRVKVVKPGSKTSFPNTEIRGTYSPPFHVEVFRNDQHRLKIVIDSENEVDLMVQTRHIRDVIVLVIRGLAQRYNSTPLNLLLKM